MFVLTHARCKALRQDKGRPQVRIQMPVPALACRGVDAVIFKDRRTIDKDTDRTHGSLGTPDNALDVRLDGKVGAHQSASPPHTLDVSLQPERIILARQVVDGDIPSFAGKPQCNLATEASCRTGNQGCSHRENPPHNR